MRDCQGTWLEVVYFVDAMISEQRKLDYQADWISQSWVENKSLLATHRIDDIQEIFESSILDRVCVDTVQLCRRANHCRRISQWKTKMSFTSGVQILIDNDASTSLGLRCCVRA